MAGNKITIQDIATRAGVAKSTVSRYLNHGYISKEKALLIDQVIRETGFQTNFFAQRLKAKDSKLVGIVMPRLDSYTAGKILAGINMILAAEDYQPLILVSDLQKQRELAQIKQLINQGVDGIIVQSTGITEEHLQLVQSSQIPIAFTGQNHQGVNCFSFDDFKAGQLVGEYLVHLNHQRVTYVGVDFQDEAVGLHRFQGFKAGFTGENREITFIPTDFSFEQAYSLGPKVMATNPTAIVCSTDNIALGLLRYFHQNHISVPAKVSLMGFGGYPFGEVSYPSLTSLAFNYEHLGARAAQFLLHKLKGINFKDQYKSTMKLITRESTAAPGGNL